MTVWWWQRGRRALARRLGRRVEVRKGDGFAGLTRWIEQGGLQNPSSADLEIECEVARLTAELAGQVRETYHRMAMQSMDAAEACSRLSSSAAARRLLAHLIAADRPRRVIELGSAFGVGSLAICHAMARSGGGRFDGIELEGWKAELATRKIRDVLGDSATVHSGAIEEVFPQLVAEDRRPIDFAFVDAVHSYEATMGYHRLLSDHLVDGATVIYDDVYWSREMARFWDDLLRLDVIRDAVCVDGQWGVVRYAPAVSSGAAIGST